MIGIGDMSLTAPRKRLSQVILGSELKTGQTNGAIVSLPVLHEDIDTKVLLAAQEAIYSYTPAHVRQVLPFVLHAVEEQSEIINSGFIDSFFTHVNYEFHLPHSGGSVQLIDGEMSVLLRYRTDYRENWTAGTISALHGFELSWAYEWTCELLSKANFDVDPLSLQDLTMFARMLGMALGKQVTDVPSFEA